MFYNSSVFVALQLIRFSQSVLDLALDVSSYIKSLEPGNKLVEEWNEFFAGSIFPSPLGIFIDLASEDPPESLLSSIGK